ncbi:amidase family protein [Streptomyces sp. NPDC048518]|uniref:amidase family protein n=1 Tax=Streptomyces sp. NPDC048518 TaxID=3155029 RepID=UPI0033DC5B76
MGLRTTPGRVPLYPAADAWGSLTVAGPLARTVADAALLLSVMAGPDPRCPLSLDTPGHTFRAPLERDLRGLRVARAPDLGGRVPVEPAVRDVLLQQVSVWRDLGCRVEEDCPDFGGADRVFRVLRAQSFRHALKPHLDASPDALRSSIVWNIEEGARLTGDDLACVAAERTRLHLAAVRFFERYDVLLAPVSQVAPFPVEWEYPYVVDGQPQHTYIDWMRSAYLVSVLGVPALSVPAGFTPDGLPVGLQIVGPPRADRAVLEVGAAYEAATRYGRREPRLAS